MGGYTRKLCGANHGLAPLPHNMISRESVLKGFGESEVYDVDGFGIARRTDHEVAALEVSVDVARLVEGLQPRDDLLGDVEDRAAREAFPAEDYG
jgi:hypothetical protein